MKRFILIYLLTLLLLPCLVMGVASASDISDAQYSGTIVVTNNSTATTIVSTNITGLNTGNLTAQGWLNSSANNCAIQYSGSDIAFMPGYGANPWCMFVNSIGTSAQLSYNFYTEDAIGGKIAYFPDASGMNCGDPASLEPSSNFSIKFSGYVDTAVLGFVVRKSGAITAYSTGSGNISLGINSVIAEEYATGADIDNAFYGATWRGQTFTLASSYTFAYATIYSYKTGTPGASNYYLKNVSGGLPTGDILTSCIVDTSLWAGAPAWNILDFGDVVLPAGTYALICSSPTSTSSNWPLWQIDQTSSGYTGGTYINSADSGSSWTAIATADAYFRVYYYLPYLSSSVVTGEHEFEVSSNSVNLTLAVDGVVVDSDATIAITNTSSDYIFGSLATPYITSANITVGGILRGSWQWEYGATFTDLSGNGNTATPSFRTTGSDTDVSAVLTSFEPISEPQAPAFVIGAGPDWFSGNITISGNYTSGNNTLNYPGRAVIEAISAATATPSQFPVTFISGFIILAASISVSAFLRQMGSASLFVKVAVLFIGFGVATGIRAYDWWMIIFLGIFAIAVLFMSKESKN